MSVILEIPLEFHSLQSGLVHGLAFWFDVAFFGSSSTVWLSTAPTEPLTHWYQVRCLLETPLFVKQGQLLTGTVLLIANKRLDFLLCVNIQIYRYYSCDFDHLQTKLWCHDGSPSGEHRNHEQQHTRFEESLFQIRWSTSYYPTWS